MEKETDRRIRKTKKAIQDALIDLICEKELERITVTELVERADVNRKTFYNHYNDVYDVVDDMEKQHVDKFFDSVKKNGIKKYAKEPNLLMHEIINEIKDNREMYVLLVNSGDKSRFISKIIAEEKKILSEVYDGMGTQYDEEWTEYFLNFWASGTMSVFESWMKSDKKRPIEDVALFFDSFLKGLKNLWFTEETE
jgi:AcrR family transcriptional regulator